MSGEKGGHWRKGMFSSSRNLVHNPAIWGRAFSCLKKRHYVKRQQNLNVSIHALDSLQLCPLLMTHPTQTDSGSLATLQTTFTSAKRSQTEFRIHFLRFHNRSENVSPRQRFRGPCTDTGPQNIWTYYVWCPYTCALTFFPKSCFPSRWTWLFSFPFLLTWYHVYFIHT